MLFLSTVTRGGVITVVFLNVFRLSASALSVSHVILRMIPVSVAYCSQ